MRWIEHRKRAVHELDSLQLGSPSQAQWSCGHCWEGGWHFPGTHRGFSHLLDFSWWFLSLEGSDQAFRSPLPRRMFARELQPVKALSTLEGGNSIHFLSYLEQNTRSIFITEQTLKFLAGLTQTLRLSLPGLRSVSLDTLHRRELSSEVLQCRDWQTLKKWALSRGSPLLLQQLFHQFVPLWKCPLQPQQGPSQRINTARECCLLCGRMRQTITDN